MSKGSFSFPSLWYTCHSIVFRIHTYIYRQYIVFSPQAKFNSIDLKLGGRLQSTLQIWAKFISITKMALGIERLLGWISWTSRQIESGPCIQSIGDVSSSNPSIQYPHHSISIGIPCIAYHRQYPASPSVKSKSPHPKLGKRLPHIHIHHLAFDCISRSHFDLHYPSLCILTLPQSMSRPYLNNQQVDQLWVWRNIDPLHFGFKSRCSTTFQRPPIIDFRTWWNFEAIQ